MALVKYNGKNVLGVIGKKGINRVIPGVNEVDDEVLNEMKAHPLFRSRMDKGLIQILKDSESKDGKRSVDEMLGLMPGIFDVKLLKKLIETDGRTPVTRAAQKQLDAIRNPSKAKEQKEDDNHFQ